MFQNPEGNNKLQHEWSECRSENTTKRQKRTIVEAAELVKEHLGKGAIGKVLVVGPQHGYELGYWKEFAEDTYGVDPVPEFVQDCRKAGHKCLECCAEEMAQHFPEGEWNVYTSHALEHCVDRALAVENMKRLMKKWAYITVPIEPSEEIRDKAHLSPIRSIADIESQLKPLRIVWTLFNPSSKKQEHGGYHCLAVKDLS